MFARSSLVAKQLTHSLSPDQAQSHLDSHRQPVFPAPAKQSHHSLPVQLALVRALCAPLPLLMRVDAAECPGVSVNSECVCPAHTYNSASNAIDCVECPAGANWCEVMLG